jgi:hypothetical protein
MGGSIQLDFCLIGMAHFTSYWCRTMKFKTEKKIPTIFLFFREMKYGEAHHW